MSYYLVFKLVTFLFIIFIARIHVFFSNDKFGYTLPPCTIADALFFDSLISVVKTYNT